MFSIVKTLEKNAQTSPIPQKKLEALHGPQHAPDIAARSTAELSGSSFRRFVCLPMVMLQHTKNQRPSDGSYRLSEPKIFCCNGRRSFSREGLTIHLKWHSDWNSQDSNHKNLGWRVISLQTDRQPLYRNRASQSRLYILTAPLEIPWRN